MIISEEKGWVTGVSFHSANKALEISAEFPRLEFDAASQGLTPNCVINTFAFNKNRPDKLDLESLRDKKVKVTVELIEL